MGSTLPWLTLVPATNTVALGAPLTPTNSKGAAMSSRTSLTVPSSFSPTVVLTGSANHQHGVRSGGECFHRPGLCLGIVHPPIREGGERGGQLDQVRGPGFARAVVHGKREDPSRVVSSQRLSPVVRFEVVLAEGHTLRVELQDLLVAWIFRGDSRQEDVPIGRNLAG